MSKSLGTLTLDLVARTAGFVAGMDKAQRESAKWKKQVKSDLESVGSGIAVASAAAVAGFAYIVNAQRELIETNGDTAKQLDTTYSSIVNLQRAGDLGGVAFEKIETASRKLNVNLGLAIQGTKAQAEAFARLGLSAESLAQMSLDEKIGTINKALVDNVQASERAAVAADIYGAKTAAAMMQLDPETIAEAARQTEIFGLNLSDIDAAKVNQANDAMGVFKMAVDGAAGQIAVQLAPVLRGVSELFLKNAEDAGGLGNVIADEFDSAVDHVSNLISVADFLGRTFTVVTSDIASGMAAAAKGVLWLIEKIIMAADYVPGMSKVTDGVLSAVKTMSLEASSVIDYNIDKIKHAMNDPLAGGQFKQFVEDAKKAGQAAAEADVAANKLAKTTGNAFDDSAEAAKKAAEEQEKLTDKINDQITAIEKAAATWGMSASEVKVYELGVLGATQAQQDYARSILDTIDAKEKQKDINKEAVNIADDLKSDEQKILDSYNKRKEIILASTIQTEAEKNEILAELEQEKNDSLLEIQGGYWENWLAAAEENLSSFDEISKGVIDNFTTGFGNAFEHMILDSQSLDDAMRTMAQSMVRSVVNAVGQMIAQWLALKAVQMLIGKQGSSAAVTQAQADGAAIAMAYAPAAAMASLSSFGANAAPAMGAIAMTNAMSVATAGLAGMAHDGIDAVPETGTWLLKKGERVTTSETSAKLDSVLNDIRGGGGSGVVINIQNAPAGTRTEKRTGSDGQQIVDVIIGDLRSDGPISRTMQNTFGNRRVAS